MAKSKGASIPAGEYDYKTLKVRGASGKIHYSRGVADAVAKACLLFYANGGKPGELVKTNELDVAAKGDRNPGLFRMAIGNALRAKVRAGTPVKIGKVRVEKLTQAVEMPKVELKAPGSAKSAKRRPAKKAKSSKPRKPRAAKPAAPVQDAVAA